MVNTNFGRPCMRRRAQGVAAMSYDSPGSHSNYKESMSESEPWEGTPNLYIKDGN